MVWGPERARTKNGPTRFSQWQIPFSPATVTSVVGGGGRGTTPSSRGIRPFEYFPRVAPAPGRPSGAGTRRPSSAHKTVRRECPGRRAGDGRWNGSRPSQFHKHYFRLL